MTASPWHRAAPRIAFAALADRLIATNLVCDPWIDDAERFDPSPLLLGDDDLDELASIARRIGAAWDEAMQLVAREPELLDTWYDYTPSQKAMWEMSGGAWHGFARMDAFPVGDGWQICELNADTPSGQSDILACAEVFEALHPELEDPNRAHGEQVAALVDRWFRAHTGEDRAPRTLGIVYPTELPEDILLIRTWELVFERAGLTVQRGSPFNLTFDDDGTVRLFGEPMDVILRHYKTDWWGDRLPSRTDEPPLPDPVPLPQLAPLLEADRAGRVLVVNPFGSMVAQDKRTMALLWARRDALSDEARATVETLIPETVRVSDIGAARLLAERADWVLKSDFGCEGEEVVIGARCTDAEWAAEVAACFAERWIAQRYFEVAERVPGCDVNLGLYLVGGSFGGLYVRTTPRGVLTGIRARVVTPMRRREPAAHGDET